MAALNAELGSTISGSIDDMVAWRGDQRYVERLSRATLGEPTARSGPLGSVLHHHRRPRGSRPGGRPMAGRQRRGPHRPQRPQRTLRRAARSSGRIGTQAPRSSWSAAMSLRRAWRNALSWRPTSESPICAASCTRAAVHRRQPGVLHEQGQLGTGVGAQGRRRAADAPGKRRLANSTGGSDSPPPRRCWVGRDRPPTRARARGSTRWSTWRQAPRECRRR